MLLNHKDAIEFLVDAAEENVRDHQRSSPTMLRLPDGSLRLRVGGGAYAFSFHTPQLTTGRDAVRAGSSVHQGGPWVSVVEPAGNRAASDTER